MKDNKLPKIRLSLYLRNDDSYQKFSDHEVECEVLTIHLNTGKMRIRFKWLGKNESRDVPLDQFWEHYILAKID